MNIYLIINEYNHKHNINPYLYIGSDTKDRKLLTQYASSSRSLRRDLCALGGDQFSKHILWEGGVSELEQLNLKSLVHLEECFHVALDVVRDARYYNKVKANTNFSGQGRAVYVYVTDPHQKTVVLPTNHPDVIEGLARGFQAGKKYPLSEEHRALLKRPKTEEHKQKIRLAHLGKSKPGLRKPKSEEHRKNMRKPKSEEHRNKLLQQIELRQNRPVVQMDLLGNHITTYASIRDAALSIGNNRCRSSISDCCRGKQRVAYGYAWKYA